MDATGEASSPRDPDPLGAVPLSHAQALAPAAGVRGALFAQWGREKRRRALQQRYGEDAGSLVEDGDTALQDGPSD